eukprot:SAG31_NODE_4677_length_3040_cov_3.849031_5_plen_87_part_00
MRSIFDDLQLPMHQKMGAHSPEIAARLNMPLTLASACARISTIYGLAEVLFGMRSPAGRTIQTIYPSSYADEISIFDFNMRPGTEK